MRCPSCGLDNPAENSFCASCAKELTPGAAAQFEPPRAKDRNRRRMREAIAVTEQGLQAARVFSGEVLLASRFDRSTFTALFRQGLVLLFASLLPGLGHLLLGEYLLGLGFLLGFGFFLACWQGFINLLPYSLALGFALTVMGLSLLDILRHDPYTGARRPLRPSQLWLTLALVLGIVALVQLTIAIMWERVIPTQPILQLTPRDAPRGNSVFLETGDRLLFSRRAYLASGPARGDVVLARVENMNSVQRILAVPGDLLEVKRGRIYRNGEILSAQAYPLQPVNPVEVYGGGIGHALWSQRLKNGQYAVWGVILPGNEDVYEYVEETTAYLGPVIISRSDIRGKAWLLYYPYTHRRYIR
jgi:signal peptidase I